MVFQAGFVVDGNKIAWNKRTRKGPTSYTKLTTVSDDQKTVIIQIFIKTPRGKRLAAKEEISGLLPKPAGTPVVIVETRFSTFRLHYRIKINDIDRASGTAALKRSFAVPAAAALLLLAGAAAFLLLPKTTADQPVIPESQAGAEISEPPAQSQPAVETAEPTEEKTAEAEPEADEPPPVVWIENELFDSHSAYFKPDSAVLTIETRTGLDNFITGLPESEDFEEGNFKLAVRGHCARYGTEEGRAELSLERAENTADYIKYKWGIEAEYVLSGAGAAEPVTLDRDEQHLNRRADVQIKGTIKTKQN